MRPVLLVLPVLLGVVSSSGGAQEPSRQAAAARYDSARVRAGTDSTARARVLEHLWEILAFRLQAASLDTATSAWTLSLPADELPWSRIADHLRLALRARAPTPRDTVVWHLTVGPIRIEGDTAWTTVTLNHERRCAHEARAAGWGNRHEVFVPRVPGDGRWGKARTRQVVHGDRASCAPSRR
jgi:hypothetical protein